MLPNLLICADATPEIGVGHVMRCLAIAQAWQSSGGKPWFSAAAIHDTIRTRLRTEGFEVFSEPGLNEPGKILELSDRLQAGYIVLDGRQFGSDCQQKIKLAGRWLLVVDDYGAAGHYYADCLLNADLVPETMYSQREPYTRLLLGPEYALLRKEFFQAGARTKSIAGLTRVLVTMGGSDPENMTQTVIEGLRELKAGALQVRVLAGGANPRLNLLRDLAKGVAGKVEVLSDVTDMPAQMHWADIAITAAGVTLWELLYMGTAVICWPRYPADVSLLETLSNKGAVLPLTRDTDAWGIATTLNQLLTNAELKRSLQSAGRKIIDGQGAQRVVDIFSQVQIQSSGGRRY